MAQKVEVRLEDDLDGGPAEHTVTFALDGKDYEIDLSNSNAEKLREALRPYVATGRKASRTCGTRNAWTRPRALIRTRRRSAHGPKAMVTRFPTAAASTSPSRTPTMPLTNSSAGRHVHCRAAAWPVRIWARVI